ncbi:hypothetical protein APASM_5125 [Actinosynnema pretiosum subsp. pretiosum]|nr:hypothetical protein APASM_5125 [Actinosynnema pretiosum subsp. pretiosum]
MAGLRDGSIRCADIHQQQVEFTRTSHWAGLSEPATPLSAPSCRSAIPRRRTGFSASAGQ